MTPAVPEHLQRRVLSTVKLARARLGRPPAFAHFGEDAIIARRLAELDSIEHVCVDIAAGDGVEGSNSLPLYRAGWRGLAVEFEPHRFRFLAGVLAGCGGVGLARCMVTPENVVALLRANGIPREFGFLSLDIDGYDHFVLDALLSEYRPALMCVEVNEKVPPPLKFTIKWDPGWNYLGDHLYGQSIVALAELAERHDYALVELHYNNAFLVPAERAGGAGLTPEAAYAQGYADRPDRRERMPWNADMEPLQTMDPEQAVAFMDAQFPGRAAQYQISW